MKEFSLEQVFPNSEPKKETEYSESEEELADIELTKLKNDPRYPFLVGVPKNKAALDEIESESAVKALKFAREKIREALVGSLRANKMVGKSMEKVLADPDSISNFLEHIMKHRMLIGEGADGFVVSDKTDVYEVNPDICYKFALQETQKRGRNSMLEESEFQALFYELAENFDNKDIGIPKPFYEVEVFNTKMMAMEKLNARTVDQIRSGMGVLPEWFDVDRFCDSIEAFLENAHANNLYHRDMHFGNVMISQAKDWEEGEPMGFIIDFGLSGQGFEEMEPYKKEIAGHIFTYDNDCVRIQGMRQTLKDLRNKKHVH